MKTNRIFSIIATAALAITASAQQSAHDNYIGVNFSGGLNTMLYQPANGKQAVGMGFDAGIHYAHFFNKWAGLGIGAKYSWSNAYTTYNWNEVTTGLTHPSSPYTPFNLTTGFNQFVERQNVGVISIPVEALFRKVFNDRIALIGGVGLSLDLPLHGAYTAQSGSYSTTGVFPNLGPYSISDAPEIGFSTYTTTQDAKFNNRAKVGGSVICDLGTRIAFNNNWGMYIGVSFGYGFTNLLADAKADPMLSINATDPSKIDYRGTFDSNETSKANLINCGLRLAFDFGWSSKSKAKAKAEAERLAAEQAAAAEQARLDSIAAAQAAERLAAEAAAAEASRLASEKARLAAEQARQDSIKAAEAEQARLQAEKAAHIAALKAKGETVTVHFETGGTNLQFKPGEQNIVDEIAEVMAADPSMRIVITGHTDNTGNAEQNLKVWGIKRAESLKEYMVKKGVSADQIRCESKGQTEPAASNKTADGRATNRRANIRFE